MEIKFSTVKKLLLNEYEQMYKDTCEAVRRACIADACREMVYLGYNVGKQAIEQASNFEELNDAVSTCGYRMSLQEWIDSY